LPADCKNAICRQFFGFLFRKLLHEKRLNLVRKHRPIEVIALYLVAALVHEELELVSGLHTFEPATFITINEIVSAIGGGFKEKRLG